jgi:hypothetical protein
MIVAPPRLLSLAVSASENIDLSDLLFSAKTG